MKRVKNNINFLRVLCKCNKKMMKAIIHTSDKELITCICECILNCVNGNIKLSEGDLGKLKRFKSILRELLNKRKPMKNKKKLLIQHGNGFLPILIPTIIEALASFLN